MYDSTTKYYLIKNLEIGIILVALSYMVCGKLTPRRDVVWLHSPRTTSWGKCGKKEFCPMNSFVTGMRLKMDFQHSKDNPAMDRKNYGDNTALNAVQLLCTTLYGDNSKNITSATGRFGSYGKVKYCKKGLATGYQLRSQNGQGNVKDDVAAVDFKLICKDFHDSMSYVIYKNNKLLPWGHWTQKQHCPSKFAVCGIATQVEDLVNNSPNEDETTLNNVDIACCPVYEEPLKFCELKYNWETMTTSTCNPGALDCILSTGFAETEQLLRYRKFYNKMGYVRDFNDMLLKTMKFKATKKYSEKINNISLKNIISKTKIDEKKSSLLVKCEEVIQQLVVTCDFIMLYTYKSRCVPNENAENVWESKGLYFRATSRSEIIFWSYNCDFTGGNLTNKRTPIADCGDMCFSNSECTHFVWNKYNEGTCWMKGFGTVETPAEKYNEYSICGWIDRSRI